MQNKEKFSKTKIKISMAIAFIALALSFSFVQVSYAKQDSNNNSDSSNSNANANANSNTNNSPNQNINDNSQNTERYANIDKSLEQKQKDLSDIESKIQTYSKMVEIKQTEQKTLASQINIIDDTIGRTQEEIRKSEKDIEITDLEIQQLELKISEQNDFLKQKQSALKVLLNDLYRKDEKELIEVMLSYSGLSSFVQELAYNEQANERIFNKLQEINSIREDLTLKQQAEKDKHDQITKNIKDKNDKTYYLQGEQDSREKLLADTQGEEGRYQELLQKVEEEKKTLLGDIDELSSSKSSELGVVQSNQPKPTSGLAGTDWYFAQRDPRWGSSSIGNSNTPMGKYGCAVTCVSMILRYHNVNITPGILAHQPIFSSDLIVWPDRWQNVQRVGGYSHGNIDWDVIDKEIANHNPVIVFVRANGRGAGHYVVIHHKDNKGKYVVHDPYWGPNIYLDSTRQNISVLYGSSTSVDQMIIYHNLNRNSTSEEAVNQNQNSAKTDTNENNNANVNSNKNSNKNSNSNKN